MSRRFRIEEAERILPEVEKWLREAVAQRSAHQKATSELQRLTHHIQLTGGAKINPGEVLLLKAQRDSAKTAMQNAVDRILDTGCQVKDLELGLVDFPTLYRCHEVFLCWKLGEPGILFWHGDEGFQGRQTIDEEFLAEHQGDPEQ
jgi:hypothetical protein